MKKQLLILLSVLFLLTSCVAIYDSQLKDVNMDRDILIDWNSDDAKDADIMMDDDENYDDEYNEDSCCD